MNLNYKVSVLLITYNHEKYIAQAIESVLSQKTTFPIELVIGDDKSTDNTLKIAKGFKNTQHVTIKVLDRINNSRYSSFRRKYGHIFNFTDILSNCTGQYIAMLDGDDYFTDSSKLQKQVDFLNANPDFSVCFHNASLIFENGDPSILFHPDEYAAYLSSQYPKGFPTVEDLFKGNIIPTASCVFRNTGIKFPKKFYKSPFYDLPLHIMNANRGKIKFINEVMSDYRIQSEGMWNKLNNIEKLTKRIECLKICNKLLKRRYNKNYISEVVPLYFELFKIYRHVSFFKSVKYGIKLLILQKYNTTIVSKKDITSILKTMLLERIQLQQSSFRINSKFR